MSDLRRLQTNSNLALVRQVVRFAGTDDMDRVTTNGESVVVEVGMGQAGLEYEPPFAFSLTKMEYLSDREAALNG
jgi:hypothetical protein